MTDEPQERKGLRRTSLRGTATLETLVCLGPFLLVFFTMTQLGLLLWARLLVSAAAERAVRAASVMASDAPKHYDDSPRGDFRTGSPRHLRLLALVKRSLWPLGSSAEGSRKLLTVERALSPELAKVGPFVASPSELHLVAARDESTKQAWIEKDATIEVEVRHLIPCLVPLGARFVCRENHEFGEDEALVDEFVRGGLKRTEVRELLGRASRFYELRATARLPNQGASYFKETSP